MLTVVFQTVEGKVYKVFMINPPFSVQIYAEDLLSTLACFLSAHILQSSWQWGLGECPFNF